MKGRAGLGVALWCLALGAAQAQDKQRVSLEFQDAPVTVILQALADYRQMNLIAAPGVSGTLTLRLDKDMADAIGSNNLATGAAIDWLRYMEINRSHARVDLDNLGELTLSARIDGINPQKNAKREVILNYRHQENVFQLWRSLRFGDNLQEWLEQALSQPGEQQ